MIQTKQTKQGPELIRYLPEISKQEDYEFDNIQEKFTNRCKEGK